MHNQTIEIVVAKSTDIEIVARAHSNVQVNAGSRGLPGLSAYALAVANGFVGTESEWLQSLQAEIAVSDDIENTIEERVDGLFVSAPQLASVQW